VLVVLGGVMLLCCLFGVAVALPGFLRFGARSKQSECKANLKAIYTAERAHVGETDTLAATFKELGWMPEGHNRYAYFLGDDVVPADGKMYTAVPPPPTTPPFSTAVTGKCPDCRFVAACAGNIDTDAAIDVWSISDQERHAPDGTVIPAGVPFNDQDDDKL